MRTIVSDLTHAEAAKHIWWTIVPSLHIGQKIGVLVSRKHLEGCMEDLRAAMVDKARFDPAKNEYREYKTVQAFGVNNTKVIYIAIDINDLRGFSFAWVWTPSERRDDLYLIMEHGNERVIISHD